MTISATQVKELREKTGAGFMACKGALTETGGNMFQAQKVLLERGLSKARGRQSRKTTAGKIFSYIHPGSQVGVLLEMNCETDFVARTDEFETLCKDVALQVAAMDPGWVSPDDVPEELRSSEIRVSKVMAESEGKPPHIAEKIANGKIDKFYADNCLLNQPFVKDSSKRVAQVVAEAAASVGENICVKRFQRFEVGE